MALFAPLRKAVVFSRCFESGKGLLQRNICQLAASRSVVRNLAPPPSSRSRSFGTDVEEKYIVRSPAPSFESPKGNVTNTILKNSHKWSSKTALVCFATGKTVSYGELEEQTRRWTGFLKQIGVKKDQVVTMISSNCIQYGPIFLGTAAIGAALSTINWKSTPDEISKKLSTTNPIVIIVGKESEDNLMKALKGNTDHLQLFTVGKSTQLKAINVDTILYEEGGPVAAADDISGDEAVFIPFSSGTTGPPKAVAISHNAMIANIYAFCNPYHDVLRESTENFQEVTVAVLPLFHLYGMHVVFCMGIYNGHKIIVPTTFDSRSYLNMIVNHKVSLLHTVPTLLNFLNNSPDCNPQTMERISTVLCGGAPLYEVEAHRLTNKIKRDVSFFEGYGMTEILISNLTSRRLPRLGTCGQLVSNVEAKVVIETTGEVVGVGEKGEICIRTPSEMIGYMNNPKGTADILKNGWAHTGDIGYYDAEGFFYIVDRTKDLIKVKGMQVSPSEIEGELQKHSAVQECCVIGIPDERAGEVPKAFVVLKEKVTEDDLHKFLGKKLAKHNQLVGGIAFVESLPKSDTGKVLRKVLRERA